MTAEEIAEMAAISQRILEDPAKLQFLARRIKEVPAPSVGISSRESAGGRLAPLVESQVVFITARNVLAAYGREIV